MERSKIKFLGMGLLVLIGSGLGWQRLTQGKLREEIEALRARDHDAAHLRAENQRLSDSRIPASELNALRADHAVTVRLRDEIEALKSREKMAADVPAGNETPVNKPAPPVQVPADPDMRPASAWKNVGRATPETALETALWAAVGGDMDTLSEAIHLDSTSRTKIEAALAGLPPELRAQYGTPEKLLALMVARDMPSTPMKMERQPNPELPPNVVPLKVKVQDARGMKNNVLVMQKLSDDWQLVVPSGVINKYVGLLTAPPDRPPSVGP